MITTTRVYSKRQVYFLLANAQAHGNYRTLLKREGIEPCKVVSTPGGKEQVYFPAEPVDDLVRDILA